MSRCGNVSIAKSRVDSNVVLFIVANQLTISGDYVAFYTLKTSALVLRIGLTMALSILSLSVGFIMASICFIILLSATLLLALSACLA